MKCLLMTLGSGETMLVDAPDPRVREGWVLIRSRCSLVSMGTERMLKSFGSAGILGKIRQQPDKARQVLAKVATDGLAATYEAVSSKLAQTIPIGYSTVGVVVESRCSRFRPGDRVASNGPHADLVHVPGNLCAAVPAEVPDESAAFTVVGSIGLQGIRLIDPTLGERVAVFGAGLIGLIAIQMLRAAGCSVLAIDFDPKRLELASAFGAEACELSAESDPVPRAMEFTRGRGVDAVLIATATRSGAPVSQAARMCRKRGRIVLVGTAGLELDRSEFYDKELTLQVSCSYGPGRYDPSYEEGGHDYPIGFVRWTEQRNFEAVLELLASGGLKVESMVSRRVPFESAASLYEKIETSSDLLGVLLKYGEQVWTARTLVTLAGSDRRPRNAAPTIGVVGAGNYASRMLIPSLKKAGAVLDTVCSSGGASAAVLARRWGFRAASSDARDVIGREGIDAVVIATRHDSHARLAIEALRAGQDVFVEKPLAIDVESLKAVRDALLSSGRILMVGFNRRFSPLVLKARAMLERLAGPKVVMTLLNAGAVPAGHWTHDPAVGGGRIVGEACHHIDLIRALVGARISSVQVAAMVDRGNPLACGDTASISLSFEDGSIGTIHYLANGPASFPKERVEVFAGGKVLQIDNFKSIRGFNWHGLRRHRLFRQDKGQRACVTAFLEAVKGGGTPPVPGEEVLEVSLAAIEAAELLRRGPAVGEGRIQLEDRRSEPMPRADRSVEAPGEGDGLHSQAR